jgi:hypothetical protein
MQYFLGLGARFSRLLLLTIITRHVIMNSLAVHYRCLGIYKIVTILRHNVGMRNVERAEPQLCAYGSKFMDGLNERRVATLKDTPARMKSSNYVIDYRKQLMS